LLKSSSAGTRVREGQARFEENTSQTKQGLPVTKSPAFQCLPAGPLQAYGPGTYAVEFIQARFENVVANPAANPPAAK